MPTDTFLDPLVQHGFLGLSALLLALLTWLIRRLLILLEETVRVIHRNTHAIESLDRQCAELVRHWHGMHDRLLSRPCIAERE